MESAITVKPFRTKTETYRELLPQIESLISGEPDLIGDLANVASALRFSFPYYSCVGFYFNLGSILLLGPFQGKPACTRLEVGKGVCGTAAAENRTVIVPNVYEFPGHIFCDESSKSEIVVPLNKDNKVLAVLDIDSYDFNQFDEVDALWLEKIAQRLSYSLADSLISYCSWVSRRFHGAK